MLEVVAPLYFATDHTCKLLAINGSEDPEIDAYGDAARTLPIRAACSDSI